MNNIQKDKRQDNPTAMPGDLVEYPKHNSCIPYREALEEEPKLTINTLCTPPV
jgi:hypothetical protein